MVSSLEQWALSTINPVHIAATSYECVSPSPLATSHTFSQNKLVWHDQKEMPQTPGWYFCIVFYRFVNMLFVTPSDKKEFFFFFFNKYVPWKNKYVNSLRGVLSSQEVWLQPLGKWCIPFRCSWWLSGDNGVNGTPAVTTCPWPEVERMTLTGYKYLTFCGEFMQNNDRFNIGLITKLHFVFEISLLIFPSHLFGIISMSSTASLAEVNIQNCINRSPSFFCFHLHISIMSFSVWWHFNAYKSIQWGGSAWLHSPVWCSEWLPFLCWTHCIIHFSLWIL